LSRSLPDQQFDPELISLLFRFCIPQSAEAIPASRQKPLLDYMVRALPSHWCWLECEVSWFSGCCIDIRPRPLAFAVGCVQAEAERALHYLETIEPAALVQQVTCLSLVP
jgi:hypothetical protein